MSRSHDSLVSLARRLGLTLVRLDGPERWALWSLRSPYMAGRYRSIAEVRVALTLFERCGMFVPKLKLSPEFATKLPEGRA